MRRIASFNNGQGPRKEEFVDTIIRITGAYLKLRNNYPDGVWSFLISNAAHSLGWAVAYNSAVTVLVEHIAKRSQYQSPLIREKDWNDALSVEALKELAQRSV